MAISNNQQLITRILQKASRDDILKAYSNPAGVMVMVDGRNICFKIRHFRQTDNGLQEITKAKRDEFAQKRLNEPHTQDDLDDIVKSVYDQFQNGMGFFSIQKGVGEFRTKEVVVFVKEGISSDALQLHLKGKKRKHAEVQKKYREVIELPAQQLKKLHEEVEKKRQADIKSRAQTVTLDVVDTPLPAPLPAPALDPQPDLFPPQPTIQQAQQAFPDPQTSADGVVEVDDRVVQRALDGVQAQAPLQNPNAPPPGGA